MIEVRNISQKGRGIIATNFLPKDTLIEASLTSSFPAEQWMLIKKTDIFKYCFVIPSEYSEQQDTNGYIVFGLTAFCNHSESPNAYVKWTQDDVGLWAHLIALVDIQAGEEVSIFYTNINEYSLASEFV